jgi:hypothetical protein
MRMLATATESEERQRIGYETYYKKERDLLELFYTKFRRFMRSSGILRRA